MDSENPYVGPVVPHWSPRPVPEPITKQGAYVRVEPLTSARFADLFAATCGESDDELWTYRPIGRPTSLADLWMHLSEAVESPSNITYCLTSDAGPRGASGVASLSQVDTDHGRIELSSVLFGRALQRTAAATEALHLLMSYVFDDLGYRRLEWKCDVLNEASRHAAQRLGFSYEGSFRQHMVIKGRNRDTAWFALTDDEWPQVSQAHRAWLDPGNFSADGAQRSSLSELTAR